MPATVGALRGSRQNRLVLEIVRQSRTHPTAQDVYEQARQVIPSISLGTVYRNLRRMAQQGVLQENKIGDHPTRFEVPLRRHYHVICTECGRLEDLELRYQHILDRKAQRLVDFRLQEHRIEFYGVCPECRVRSKATQSGNRGASPTM
ncbi:MAG: transcriptional repressor [Acidobacteria bacterium]|nr:transcriptional repressor [Acidobacteriota bacterium]